MSAVAKQPLSEIFIGEMHPFLHALVSHLREAAGRLVYVTEEDIDDLETLNYLYWPEASAPPDMLHGWLHLARLPAEPGVTAAKHCGAIFGELLMHGAKLYVLQKAGEAPPKPGAAGILYALMEPSEGTLDGARKVWQFIVADLVRDGARLRGEELTRRQARIARYVKELGVLIS